MYCIARKPFNNRHYRILVSILLFGFLSACAPEVGSEKWCEKLEEKPKDEWTVKEVKDYAKHCLLR